MDDRDALGSQPPRLLRLVSTDEPAPGGDDPPPGQALASRKDIPHGSGCAGMARLLGDLSVSGDLTGHERRDHLAHAPLELARRSHPAELAVGFEPTT